MLAATAYDLLKSGFSFSIDEWGTIGLGFIVAFITALLVVKWLINYIKQHSFAVFGWYRIVIGFALLIFFLA
jgi:undecaprenyl-diphosphatase